MPTLAERKNETAEMLETRLKERTYEFRISMDFAKYIESMEVYILLLERRMKALESASSEKRDPAVERPRSPIPMAGSGR